MNDKKKLGNIWDLTLSIPKFIGKSAYTSDILGKSLGPIYGIFREIKLTENYKEPDNFKKWFLEIWKVKDEFIQNYKKFVYEKIEFDDNRNSHMVYIILVCLITYLLLSNKYGRYYLIISFIISYLLIIFKL